MSLLSLAGNSCLWPEGSFYVDLHVLLLITYHCMERNRETKNTNIEFISGKLNRFSFKDIHLDEHVVINQSTFLL